MTCTSPPSSPPANRQAHAPTRGQLMNHVRGLAGIPYLMSIENPLVLDRYGRVEAYLEAEPAGQYRGNPAAASSPEAEYPLGDVAQRLDPRRVQRLRQLDQPGERRVAFVVARPALADVVELRQRHPERSGQPRGGVDPRAEPPALDVRHRVGAAIDPPRQLLLGHPVLAPQGAHPRAE